MIASARRESEALAVTARAVRESGRGDLTFIPCDLENTAEIPALFKTVREEHGDLYGLVNNAGIGTDGLLATMPTVEIERLIRLNTLAPILLARHASRMMMSTGEGRIISLSSVVATTGYSGLSVYAATKASLLGFTRSLARELGILNITVNTVAPGFVDTEMTSGLTEDQRASVIRRSALKRLAEAADVAHAVSFLMSDKARNITGVVLTIDAGNTA